MKHKRIALKPVTAILKSETNPCMGGLVTKRDLTTREACHILRHHREEQRARNRKKLTPRKRQLLRDLRAGLIAGLVAGIVCLIEFVTLK